MTINTPSTESETDTDRSMPRTGSTTFINTSGGLLTDELVSKLRQRQCGESAVRPETFALPDTEPPEEADIEAEIGDTWDTLRERWDELTMDETLFHMDVSDARTKWILKLFQNLGFEPVFQRENLEAGGIEANLSHKGWPDGEIESYGEMEGRTAPILHTVEPDQKLDEKPEDAPRGSKSPHDTLQEFLNASDEHDWAVVTNGVTLRILRDFYHTYTRGYVEFDLENMFTSRNYGDFRALYRLCHATRFVESVVSHDEDDDVEAPLEQLYQVALSTGVKVGQDLQSNVVSAIETLGTGLLNQEIRDYLEEGGEEEAKEYYQEILLLVYRLLFLMYAEQRGMMASRDSLYTDEYSITNLREEAETRRSGSDRNTDLWHGLQSTFRLVEKGDDELGVPCYNGMLFDSDRLEWISESECSNDVLLDAVEDLTLIEHEGTRQRISYADLGVEEIGSVYESLLEFTPRLASEVTELEARTISRGEFYLDDRGTERKETGSYYTNPNLVQELVQSALKPVLKDRLEDANTAAEKENALLTISVCDPASGSGAFLIAANNFLADQLARVRSDSNYPPEDQIREARRDVLQHCIYGVDLNPMAVELAKVSLWINSAVEDKPLNFLNHHIKCGNSLIGANSELIENDFPVDAYETSGGRDWHVGNEIRKRVRNENKERSKESSEASLQQWGGGKQEYVDIAEQLEKIEEDDTEGVEKKKQLYTDLRQSNAFQQEKLAYDIWTAAFYWPMDGSASEYPSPATIEKIRRNPSPKDEALLNLIERATQIAEEEQFFHWELEFPEVYQGDSTGFDVILGNPPWEKVEFQEKEFFITRSEEIANAQNKAKRGELIDQLENKNPQLYRDFEKAKRRSENRGKFFRDSGRYPLTGKGDLNYYHLFAEHDRESINVVGRVGIVIASGIATDYYSRDFFQDLIKNKQLVSLYDFENSNGLFPEVHNSFKFSLLTLTGNDLSEQEAEFAFFLTQLEHLRDSERKFSLSAKDIELLNPNTKTCPTFKSQKDAKLTKKIYDKNNILIKEKQGDQDTNPWGISFLRMFDMANDSNLFYDRDDIETEHQMGNIIDINDEIQLPLYEGKMYDSYNSRAADITVSESNIKRKGQSSYLSEQELQDPGRLPKPRYWVNSSVVEKEISELDSPYGYLSYKAVTSPTNRRTLIATQLPRVALSHNTPLILTDFSPSQEICLLVNLNSYVLDYVIRNKADTTFLSFFYIKQAASPSPDDYTPELREEIIPKALELIYTGWDLVDFADHVWADVSDPLQKAIKKQWNRNVQETSGGNTNTKTPEWVETLRSNNDIHIPYAPFKYDEFRRLDIKAELNAIVAYIYDIKYEEFEYILDTFSAVRRDQLDKFGEYKTKQLALKYFEEYNSQNW